MTMGWLLNASPNNQGGGGLRKENVRTRGCSLVRKCMLCLKYNTCYDGLPSGVKAVLMTRDKGKAILVIMQ